MGVNKKKIILISSGQPALNPRLVKEADALSGAGYDVLVIYQYWNAWATRMDEEMLPLKPWKAVRVGGSPSKGLLVYCLTRLIHKAGRLIAGKLLNSWTAEWALGRCARLLAAEALGRKADLYIAHNLAALPAAVKAAHHYSAKCGFDAEDLHRYETSNDPADFDVRIKSSIENKYIPKTDYVTASSDEIAAAYEKLFPSKKVLTVRNVFPASPHTFEGGKSRSRKIRLLWFSQSVGLSRGIQDVIRAMKVLEKEDIEFTITGLLNADTKAHLDTLIKDLNFSSAPQINFDPPINPDHLVRYASAFDIGMATEPGFSINNNLALSNKIFTYLNAGLAVVASDTQAQEAFLSKFPGIGLLYKRGDHLALAHILNSYLAQTKLLKQAKLEAYTLSQKVLNWETESRIFIEMVQSTLNKASR